MRAIRRIRKADLTNDEQDELDRILLAIRNGRPALLYPDIEAVLLELATAGYADAMAQIGFANDASIVNQANEYAIEYARERAAEMVGMKWVDGELIPNPNAEWQIDEGTREALRGTVATAIEEGWSNDQLADAIGDSYAFSDDRAETIARTETAFADVGGNLQAYEDSGLVAGKEWVYGAGCCEDCEELGGTIVALDEDFPGDAGDGPPLHPNCRCDVIPVIPSETETE